MHMHETNAVYDTKYISVPLIAFAKLNFKLPLSMPLCHFLNVSG